ncbi:MAG: hypothetical protein QXL98_04385 [Thermofilaceae archaeon]
MLAFSPDFGLEVAFHKFRHRFPNAGLRKPWMEITQETSQRFLLTAEKIIGKIEELFEQAQRS